jgi:hypothetical protein
MNYKQVLTFYKRRAPRKARDMKTQAKRILAQKLCGCIKKVTSRNIPEPKAIGICTRSIFNKKGLRRGRFTCKKKPSVGVTIQSET